ncbi:MAG: divalent-cation tolerance protein CutA [candidate division Zixibacteria bacterium]|nr:divalent-cation tolerance protein CutA [candidate division Zixibacteria bacterium]
MENVRVVYISVPRDEASKMARRIVEERLAACVNILPKIESFYWWEGKIERDEESLLIAKTTQQKIEKLITFVRDNHPYPVPEVIAFPLSEGLPDYINYVIDETGKG